jgi:hypothetical protein
MWQEPSRFSPPIEATRTWGARCQVPAASLARYLVLEKIAVYPFEGEAVGYRHSNVMLNH